MSDEIISKEKIQFYIDTKKKSFMNSKEMLSLYKLFPNLNRKQSVFHYLNNINEIPKCDCGLEQTFTNIIEGYSGFCSDKECKFRKESISKKIEISFIKKYGVKNIFQAESFKDDLKKKNLEKYGVEYFSQTQDFLNKRVETFIENYGVENPQQNIEVRTQTESTCKERYGSKCSFQSKELKEKGKNTLLKTFGVENISQSQLIKDKKKQKCIDKFNVENPAQAKEIKEKLIRQKWINFYQKNKDKLKFEVFNEKELIRVGDLIKFKECGHITEFLNMNGPSSEYCRICNPRNRGISNMEKEVLCFVKEHYNGKVQENNKEILKGRKELDIYLPEISFAIEFNGIYWHSSSDIFGEEKSSRRHLEKTEICESLGINLFHISDVDWLGKREIIESMILQKLGKSTRIFARKCEIKEINDKEAKSFLDENHLQGKANSSIRIGLYFKDELVSLMTLGKPRFNKNFDWELIRFCNKKGTSVIGGASKLLKYFYRNFNGSMISYADRSHSNGNLYKELGMKLQGKTSPNYIWSKNGLILTRYQTQKHKLKDLLGETFNPNLTESENMYNSGYLKFFDSGNLIFTK